MLTMLARALAVTVLVLTSKTWAMEIQQFDKMAAQDRQEYMNQLVEGAQKVLIEDGRKDEAAKVYQLFHEIHPGNVMSFGRWDLRRVSITVVRLT